MSQKSHQIYSIPTYDAAFKWILSEEDIRPSFFHAFIPGLVIQNEVRRKYEEEDAEYDRYSIYTAELAAKGEAKGKAEGLAEGLAEGEAKGKAEEKREIAKKLLTQNIPIEVIMAGTGLTRQEVEKIQKYYK